MTTNRDEIRIGVIGAGRIAQAAHLPAIEKAAGVRLVGVSDPSPTLSVGVGARYGVPAFQDTAELLASEVDAVLIATPDRLHLPLGLQALAAGKHVLVEKPLAATTAEARQLADAAATAGLLVQTGSMKRHDPALRYAQERLQRIGPILSMTTWYRVMRATRLGVQDTLFPTMIVDEAVRAGEQRFKDDGVRYRLATHGAHLFDGLRFFGGDPVWLSTRMAQVGDDISWHGQAGLPSGGLAAFEITVGVHSAWSEGVDLYGELGHIRIRSPYAFSKLGSRVELHVEADGATTVPTFAHSNPFTRQVEAFARSILDGTPTDPTPEDGVAAVALIEAAGDSAAADGIRIELS